MSLAACAELVARADPDRFRATMALPVPAREILFPLYAFNVEISRAPWVTAEPMIAQMRLQWWRDALAEIAARDVERRHEVVTPLALVLSPEMAQNLDKCVTARWWDVNTDPFADQAALDRYLHQTSGVLMQVTAQALGAGDPENAGKRGWAMGVAQWLRAVPELMARGKTPLVDQSDDALRHWARQAIDTWHANPPRDRSLRQASIAGWQTPLILKRVIDDPRRVNAGETAAGPVRTSWTLMRAAWGLSR